jgi:hypothetical protein
MSLLVLCRKVVVQSREECRQLEADLRLAGGGGKGERPDEVQVSAPTRLHPRKLSALSAHATLLPRRFFVLTPLLLEGLPSHSQAQARRLSQSISALGSCVRSDVEEVAALREAVLYLVRSTDAALHAFKRAHAWREAAKVRMARAADAAVSAATAAAAAALPGFAI